MAIIKEQEITSIREDIGREGNSNALLVRMEMGTAAVGNSMEFPPKIRNRTTTPSNNPTLGYLSEGNENTNSKRYMNSNVRQFSSV